MAGNRSYVVTGAGRGIGRAIAQRLAADGVVVALDRDADALSWSAGTPVIAAAGDAGDEAVVRAAVGEAVERAPLAGFVNNAAIFVDADLHTAAAADVVDLIAANLRLAVTGCAVAIRAFLATSNGGAIVNISSHQAQRPVPGALPYATAKAAIEGLTRAIAVDYGPAGIRCNAVALGSVATERSESLLAQRPELAAQFAAIHPLGRLGTGAEVVDVVAMLLSPMSSFVTGAVLPVDGGRSVLGVDPESRPPWQ